MLRLSSHSVCRAAVACAIVATAVACSKSSPTAPSATTSVAPSVTSGAAPDTPPVIVPYTGPTSSRTQANGSAKGKQEQLEGRVEGFPSAVPGSFVVNGRTVTTDTTTVFIIGDVSATFADVAVGQRVHVTGQAVGPDLAATLVRIQNTQAYLPVNINGIALHVTGDATAFTFMVDAREIHGDDLTQFYGNSVFSQLTNGARVNVKGLQQDGFVYARNIHVVIEGDGTIDDPSVPLPTPPPPPPPPPTAPLEPAFDPDPIQGLAMCQTYTCGVVFTVLQDVDVQSLGQWDENEDGLEMDATVGLWSVGGTLMASAVVPSGSSAPLTDGYRYATIAPVHLVAGQQYVLGSAYAMTGAPVFGAAGANPALMITGGRTILMGSGVLSFPTTSNAALFGGGNLLLVPSTP